MDSVATNFKEQYRNHLTSFRHANRRNETELSKRVWTLKDANRSFHVQGKVLRNCKPYDQASINCNLCLQEKFFIISKNYLCTLKKKKNELASSCPYRNRFTLRNFRITQRNETARIPKNPLRNLYTSVSTLCLFTKFLITLRLPRHQPLAIAYSEIFKFGGLPIIPHSLFYTRFPHPALV